jgi:integrase
MDRENLSGSVQHSENDTKADSYYAVVRVPLDDGTLSENPEWFGPFKTEEEADEKLIELNNRFNQGERFIDEEVNLADFFLWWIEEYIIVVEEPNGRKRRIRPNTYDQWKSNIKNHIIPELGHKILGDVTTTDLDNLYERKRQEGYAEGGTVRDIHKVIHKAYEHAKSGVPQQYVKVNPAAELDDEQIPSIGESRKPPFRVREKEIFLEVAKQPEFNTYWPIYHVAFETGLRRGEILGLDWDQSVFYESGRMKLHVHQQLNSSKELAPPKNNSSNRVLWVPKKQEQMLLQASKRQEQKKKKLNGEYKQPNAVFTSTTNDWIWPNKLNENFRQIREEAGIRDELTFHSIRKTHSNELLKEGVDPDAVARRMGHADTDTLYKSYRQADETEDEQIITIIENEE